MIRSTPITFLPFFLLLTLALPGCDDSDGQPGQPDGGGGGSDASGDTSPGGDGGALLDCQGGDLALGQAFIDHWSDPNACTIDDDCTLGELSFACDNGASYTYCLTPRHVDSADAMAAAADLAEADVCDQITPGCFGSASCAPGRAACIAGSCRFVLDTDDCGPQPTAGVTPCSVEGLRCGYGYDPIECGGITYQCTGGTWEEAEHTDPMEACFQDGGMPDGAMPDGGAPDAGA